MKKLIYATILSILSFVGQGYSDTLTTGDPVVIEVSTGVIDTRRNWMDKINHNFRMLSSTSQNTRDRLATTSSTLNSRIAAYEAGLSTTQGFIRAFELGLTTGQGFDRAYELELSTKQGVLRRYELGYSTAEGFNRAYELELSTKQGFIRAFELQRSTAEGADEASRLFLATFTASSGGGDNFGTHIATRIVNISTNPLMNITSASFVGSNAKIDIGVSTGQGVFNLRGATMIDGSTNAFNGFFRDYSYELLYATGPGSANAWISVATITRQGNWTNGSVFVEADIMANTDSTNNSGYTKTLGVVNWNLGAMNSFLVCTTTIGTSNSGPVFRLNTGSNTFSTEFHGGTDRGLHWAICRLKFLFKRSVEPATGLPVEGGFIITPR